VSLLITRARAAMLSVRSSSHRVLFAGAYVNYGARAAHREQPKETVLSCTFLASSLL